MKFSFFARRNILHAAVAIAVLMPTMAVGSAIARDSDPSPAEEGTPTFIMSQDEMMYWLTHTDAKLTFIGDDSINPLSSRDALKTTVTYCSTRNGSFCGGNCTVYTGGAKCLNAPNTNCLAATNDVVFCSSSGCNGDCNSLSACGTRLSNGYCYTPGTKSIAVSNA